MLCCLAFLDDDGHVQEVCKADIATEETALRWMLIVGSVWSRHPARTYEWSTMELWCEGHCRARVPAAYLNQLAFPAIELAASFPVKQDLEYCGSAQSDRWPLLEKGHQRPRRRPH